MSRLLDAQNNLISEDIMRFLPRLEPIRVENRTLDGQYHVQTIGSGARVFDLQVIVTDSGRYTIENAWATGANLRAEVESWYRTGIVKAAPGWDLLRPGPMATRLYMATFTLAVNSEGVV